MGGLRRVAVLALVCAGMVGATTEPGGELAPEVAKKWMGDWEKYLLGSVKERACDKEMGEELGWLVSPHLNGFYWGFVATGDTKWIDLMVDWGDSWIKRGVKEPDGLVGWPKADGASTESVEKLYTDNILGEAMALRPMVLMADRILKTPGLKGKYGEKAKGWIDVSEKVFAKWDSRGCWREVKGGGVWVVPTFGIDQKTGGWTEGWAKKGVDGFTLPANKENLVAMWEAAMFDATGKGVYQERAEKWWQVLKGRMRAGNGGKSLEWDYWDPAGAWDYKGKETKHWVGVHPNGGYYSIDLEGIVCAYEHKWVFGKEDIEKLIATNRDFMWDQKVKGAKFGRIDGGKEDPRWKGSAGVLWAALLPYDATLRKVFVANFKAGSWGGMGETPRAVVEMRGMTNIQ